MAMVHATPPWYYSFYLGTIWSLFIFTVIIAGFMVSLMMKFKKNKTRRTILLGRLGLGTASFCLLGYLLYLLLLMI